MKDLARYVEINKGNKNDLNFLVIKGEQVTKKVLTSCSYPRRKHIQ